MADNHTHMSPLLGYCINRENFAALNFRELAKKVHSASSYFRESNEIRENFPLYLQYIHCFLMNIVATTNIDVS